MDSTGLRAGDIMKLAFGGKSNNIGTKYAQAERTLYMQLALVSEELSEKCWRMIREGTDLVLAGDDWVELCVYSFVRSFVLFVRSFTRHFGSSHFSIVTASGGSGPPLATPIWARHSLLRSATCQHACVDIVLPAALAA